MKRLAGNQSGRRQIYGPKWQKIEGNTNEIESDDESSEIAAALPTVTAVIDIKPDLPTAGKYRRELSLSDRQSAMYKAALEGDWLAAEKLLERDPTLASEEITESGDRALHVAVANKNTRFVQKLVERMSPSSLATVDGRGYTACCYAAISGAVEIADVMMKNNPNLGTARDKDNSTPLHKAALHGKEEMVSYFLKCIRVEDLSKGEWFDLLLATIRSEIYDVASDILKKNGCIATMANKEGTALHLLARQKVSRNMAALGLAESLWAEINEGLEEASVVELMKNPPILHDAAKVGNVELITMVTHACPSLIRDTDSNGYTMFHIAVMYRQEHVFKLIHQVGCMKDLIAISQDENGNNILHLAGKSAPSNRMKTVYPSALQMRREIIWFREVRNIVPRSCQEMRNKDGQTPRDLFYKEHKSLLEKSEKWMRKAGDSCMLVAAIMLIMAFAAASIIPRGNNNRDTGNPVLLKGNWLTCFIISEALALLGSMYSILMFWTIVTWSTRDFNEDEYLHDLLYILKWGLGGLLVSTIGTITAFMSAYFVVFGEERAGPVTGVILSAYILLLLAIYRQFSAFFSSMIFVECFFWLCPSRRTLFRRLENNKSQV